MYSLPSIYTVNATVTDDCQNTAGEQLVVVVYDPAAGFTTGGGWFIPHNGSYADDEADGTSDGVGRANFGFVVKYKKGSNNPDGSLEFRYKAGDINLHSVLDPQNDFEWLMIIDSKHVRFKGNGTVNGIDDVTFKVTATDWGDPGTQDHFKIEIWPGHGLDSENNSGRPKHMMQGTLGGGNIKIH